MMTLAEAWTWYSTTREQLNLFGRFGRRHWDFLPWDGDLGRDERFKTLESRAIVDNVDLCLKHLDDFAVLILFSAFESIIREEIKTAIQAEAGESRHPFIVQMLEDAIDDVEHGSISRVLKPFKGMAADLTEEVNQVRRYRNWVAHGRRDSQPDAVDPLTAYKRLQRFLEEFGNRSSEMPSRAGSAIAGPTML
jgi:hypothetical protein